MVGKTFQKLSSVMILALIVLGTGSCVAPTSVTSTSRLLSTTPVTRFASGTKAVKINLHTNHAAGYYPSFPDNADITATPTPTAVPTAYGGDGSITYNPGLSAETFYDVDGETAMSKPDWLLDFQVGITDLPSASSTCATFGGASSYDVPKVFRVSEKNCVAGYDGTGTTSDKVFVRIVLDRDTDYIGANENLMVQVEYQASGIVPYTSNLNSNTNPEDMVDQLWKIFWSDTLSDSVSTPLKPFATFVPPNYSFCGTDVTAAPGRCSDVDYQGSPIRTKQIMFPLSSYSGMKVIQFSRMHSWITDGVPAKTSYDAFCTSNDSPLCGGVVIHSVTLMRI